MAATSGRGKRAKGRAAGKGRFVEDYLSYLLARASHHVSREFHAVLKPRGLAVAEWRVLATLDGTDGLTVGDLARHTLFEQSALTKLIDRMERKGYVARLGDPGDRRRTYVASTRQGRNVVEGLLDLAKLHEAACLAHFKTGEVETLKDGLRRLISRSVANESGS